MVNKVGADYVGLLVLGFINASVAADQMRPELRPRLAVSARCWGRGGAGRHELHVRRALAACLHDALCLHWGSERAPDACPPRPPIPTAPQEHCWASTKAPKHRLEAGTKVHFDVHAVRHHGRFVSIAGSLLHPGTGAEGFAKPPEPKAARGGGGGRPQQAGKQQQAQPEQQSEKKKKKKKEKGKKVAAAQQQQAAAAPPPAAQQQQQQGGGAVAAAAPPAAEGSGKKDKKEKKAKKDKKRDRSPAAAPAAADTGGAEQPRRKKKKHA